MAFFKTLHEIGVIPVVKINHAEAAVGLEEALKKGGFSAMEITFRSDAAEESIRRIAKNSPETCLMAGTILSIENAKRAVDAGAQAIVSPGINPEVIRWCMEQKIPILPGCATPSEVEFCMRIGLKAVKLFPAEVVGGVKMLKSLAGPYADMKFMPTGGIGPANVRDYLAQPNVLCCGGSWMVPEKAIDAGDFVRIEQLAQEAAHLLHNTEA